MQGGVEILLFAHTTETGISSGLSGPPGLHACADLLLIVFRKKAMFINRTIYLTPNVISEQHIYLNLMNIMFTFRVSKVKI